MMAWGGAMIQDVHGTGGAARGASRMAPGSRKLWARRGMLAAGLLAGFLVGCAAQRDSMLQTAPAPPELDRYTVGPVTVLVKPQPEVEFFCRLRMKAVRSDQRVMGCYLPDSHTIIAVADPYVIIHEFKHHFEGAFHD